ncbi:MAG: hypothetical protein JXP73_00565 [Deltaproteobacteria bacterium]|nr:hypothetical protein [Deltaproteobacteria bacterium]
MRIEGGARVPFPWSPVVEALLAHERIIVPQVEIVRARALARARAALRAGVMLTPSPRGISPRGHRLLVAAAASVALMAAAAAFQLARSPAPSPATGAHSPTLLGAGAVAPTAAVPEPASPPGPKAAPPPDVPPASAAASAGSGANRQASLPREGHDVLEELRLLERAQKSAARGDYAAVLEATTDHQCRFPRGSLCEEREALRVRALVGLARVEEARKAAAGFRRDFPRSVLLAKLDDMLGSSP